MTVLDEIAAAARRRVAQDKAIRLPAEVRSAAEAMVAGDPFAFERALGADGLAFICEVKRASPSKGLIEPDFHPLRIAREYQAAGAAALSVLTEPDYFQGCDEDLRRITAELALPALRKDFVVDDYQIDQAKLLGASAVLLIVALMDEAQLAHGLRRARELGLSALVETHDEDQFRRAVEAGATLIGVNNRDLRSFEIDLTTTERLAGLRPPGTLLVAESGLREAADVARVRAAGVDAVLVGETLMRAADKRAGLRRLRSGLPQIKICGLTTGADVAAVNPARPDAAGFVFAPGRRQISPAQARRLRMALDDSIVSVGVFVDQPLDQIVALVADGTIGSVQLHGQEDDAFIVALKEAAAARGVAELTVVKALRMDDHPDLAAHPHADCLLLDSTAGSGRAFDWSAIPALARPFLLAGGVGLDNVDRALELPGLAGVDVSSGAETDGVKDPAKVAALVGRVRRRLPAVPTGRTTTAWKEEG